MQQPELTPDQRSDATAPPRGAAIAVLVLAVAIILTEAIALLLELLPGSSIALQYVRQGFYLVLVLVGLLFSLAVLRLLAASRTEGRRAATLPLLALGLLALSALLVPVAGLFALGLQLLGLGGDGLTAYSLQHLISSVLSTGGGILLTLAVGVIALLMLRPRAAERTTQLPVGPTGAAVALLVISLLTAAMVPVQVAVLAVVGSTDGPLLTVNELLIAGRALPAALLIPAAGLLIVLTTGRPRSLAWTGLGLYMVFRVLAGVLVRVAVVLRLGGQGSGSEGLVFASGVVDALGALLPAVAAALVLLLRSRARSARRGDASAPSTAPEGAMRSDHDRIH